MTRRAWLIGIVLILRLAALSALATSAAAQDAPRILLREMSLQSLAGSNVWLAPAEAQLRSILGTLPEVRRQTIQLQATLDASIQENAIRWEANRVLSEGLKKKLAALDTDSPQRKQIERQMEDLKSQAVSPAEFGGVADTQRHLIELINLRQRLALNVLAVRRLVPELSIQYRQLAADPRVVRALAELGSEHRLGPMRENYDAELRGLKDYADTAFTPWEPLYLQSGRIRSSAILNESIPMVFSWKNTPEPTLLPTNIVAAAGLSVADDSPTAVIQLPSGERLRVAQIQIPTLRLGGVVLKDVPAYVLPPEAEDQGAQFSPATLRPHIAKPELERLRIVIRQSS